VRKILNNKIIIFGAGKIGRSFIGQLFSTGGFEVVFADIALPVINELNRRKKYEVVIKSDDKKEVIVVHNVRAIDTRNSELIAKEISEARILAVSVGKNALPAIFPLLAQGIIRRYNNNKSDAIDIIIAENMLDASVYFKKELQNYLPPDFPINQFVGLIETSIGKMVPIVPKKSEEEDILRVFAEPYNTLILDKKAFRKPIPEIKGLSPKENIKAWVDRKLFIHNLGHAATAYWGYYNNPLHHYVWEALEIPGIFKTVRKTMLQAANLLVKKYPDEFTPGELTEHVDDLLRRFQNRALGDTIYRVGCDLQRKLGPDDRLAGAIKLAVSLSLPYDNILKTLIVGCHFRARDENGLLFPGDETFIEIHRSGITEVLKRVCGFDENNYPQILEEGQQIEKSKFIK
jgi:mannitol-1-phosphate 5-dehydrogenase